MAFQTLIVNGTIVDGSGGPAYKADLAIDGGRIAAVGSLGDVEAQRSIDASGHAVAPGFIDMHAHSDVTLLDDPGAESKVHQGVTTEVVGNCAMSPFPAGQGGPEALQKTVLLSHVSPIKWDWTTMDGWASRLEASGISVNVAAQVGHTALRVAAGVTDDRPPTESELATMRRLAAEAVEQGAFSISTGLTLPPSSYATTDEIVALAEAIAPYDGAFYATHARVWAGNHVKAVEEAVEVGRRGGVSVQYSHMAIIDSRVFGHGEELVGVVDRARSEGLDVTYDMYPYTAAGTHLSQHLPQWLQEGGVPAMLERMRAPTERAQALTDMEDGHLRGLPWEWDKIVISYVGSDANAELVGLSTAEVAERRQADPFEAFLALIDEEDNNVGAVVHNRLESDVRFFLGHPQAMIAPSGSRETVEDGPTSAEGRPSTRV